MPEEAPVNAKFHGGLSLHCCHCHRAQSMHRGVRRFGDTAKRVSASSFRNVEHGGSQCASRDKLNVQCHIVFVARVVCEERFMNGDR